MSDQRVPDGEVHTDEMLTPEDPIDEAREQLSENDKHLREGDVTKPEETVPEEQRQKHDEDEEADHLLHGKDLREPRIEP